MEQFSYDLTLALEEETSRCNGSRAQRWNVRRRTRSTGNLPCAPQPTEDSSSSPEDDNVPNHVATRMMAVAPELNNNPVALSDSEGPETKFTLNARPDPLGNFESDSLNETTCSPARPCARRKRKFKRMAVEYETTPTTPGSASTSSNLFIAAAASAAAAAAGAPKKPQTCQENHRANLFFCGKRKRSHRDRYDYDHHKQLHSSSVPRHRDVFSSKASYLEFLNRNRAKEKIQPLNKSIISRIERIAQDSSRGVPLPPLRRPECEFKPIVDDDDDDEGPVPEEEDAHEHGTVTAITTRTTTTLTATPPVIPEEDQHHQHRVIGTHLGNGDKPGSLESNYSFQEYGSYSGTGSSGGCMQQSQLQQHQAVGHDNKPASKRESRKHRHHKRSSALKMQLQFDDPASFMDCSMADLPSSGSLSTSSSSSEEDSDQTTDSDREGDDELTDWPGNEAMINFASRNDFKRARPPKLFKALLPLINSDDVTGQDDDTLMSGDELMGQPQLHLQGQAVAAAVKATATAPVVFVPRPGFMPVVHSQVCQQPAWIPPVPVFRQTIPTLPIDISTLATTASAPQIESEMSGETSNHHLMSSPNAPFEVREIRAGCRRVREERPSFSIIASVNEDLAKFLQDGKQMQLRLPDSDAMEHEKLLHLAKLYSLHMTVEDGMAVLTKTSNTTQPARVDRANISKRLLSDFKRRCYGDNEQQPMMEDMQQSQI